MSLTETENVFEQIGDTIELDNLVKKTVSQHSTLTWHDINVYLPSMKSRCSVAKTGKHILKDSMGFVLF